MEKKFQNLNLKFLKHLKINKTILELIVIKGGIIIYIREDLEEKRSYVFTRFPSNLSEFRNTSTIITDVTLDDLLKAFEEFLKKQKLKMPASATVTKKEYSVDERSNMIRGIIKLKGKRNFLELFDDISKPYVIVTFLSVLDLAKKNEILITQDNNFGEIFIEGSKV